MITKKNLPVLCFAVLFFLLLGPRAALSAEILVSDQWGYAVDLPKAMFWKKKVELSGIGFPMSFFRLRCRLPYMSGRSFPERHKC